MTTPSTLSHSSPDSALAKVQPSATQPSATQPSATQPSATQPGSGAMFDRIARRYDTLNRILSLGIDRGWRRRQVAALELEPGHRVLDLATGTADVALEILRQEPSARVLGVDPSSAMLEIGRDKLAASRPSADAELREGSAEELPFEDDSFDGVTIAFGIRNVPNRARALAEMARVTRPGGRIAILELAEPDGGLLAPFARFHIRQVVPRLGALLSGEREYRYLQSSIAGFPPPPQFAAMMEENGLEVLRVEELTFGVCSLFVARPAEEVSR